MRITRSTVRLVLPLLLAVLPAVTFGYGNGSSFSRAATSLVDYTDSPLRPAIECTSLIDNDKKQLIIISAVLVVANETTAEHCQVYGIIAPEIQFSLQLPSHWNGRLYVHGNGGDGGESIYGEYGSEMRNRAVTHGFVATFSNTGHASADFQGSRWAYNSAQREIDYSYRALHLNTLAAKRISQRYYGRAAARTYFDGCSTGGGQGLRAAQRFPTDFDGIVAGAPVFDPVTLLLYVWNNQRAQQLMQLDSARLALLAEWLMQQYDSLDGAADGVISNPAAIDFDARRDLLGGGDRDGERHPRHPRAAAVSDEGRGVAHRVVGVVEEEDLVPGRERQRAEHAVHAGRRVRHEREILSRRPQEAPERLDRPVPEPRELADHKANRPGLQSIL